MVTQPWETPFDSSQDFYFQATWAVTAILLIRFFVIRGFFDTTAPSDHTKGPPRSGRLQKKCWWKDYNHTAMVTFSYSSDLDWILGKISSQKEQLGIGTGLPREVSSGVTILGGV